MGRGATVIEAAKRAGVRKIFLLSFLRARPDCGSSYHESKWASEELIRASGLDYTILKAGMIYGRGDHLVDHLSHTAYTFRVFPRWGFARSRFGRFRLATSSTSRLQRHVGS